MADRGFILQPTFRIESRRPVVWLYGRLENGETFLVRDASSVPHGFVRERDRTAAAALGAAPLAPTGRTTFTGEPVLRFEAPAPNDLSVLVQRLEGHGIHCFESDVPFITRFLVERGIKGSLSIDGRWHAGDGIDRIYDDPRLEPAEWTPSLSVLSFDIETDPDAHRVLSIALYGCGAAEVFVVGAPYAQEPPHSIPVPDERALITAFCRRVRELDPDVLTGWNVIDFDLAVLARCAERVHLPFEIGRGPGALRIRPPSAGWRGSSATVPGRLVLDGIDLLRGSSVRMERYNLDFVAKEVLGEGKTIHGSSRVAEILRLYHHDRTHFVLYNLTDARLVLEILDALHLVELAVLRSRITGMPPDRVSASIASFDFLYLSELGRRGIVAPDVHEATPDDAPTSGGHVLEPVTGLHHGVLVFDFTSLYPSVIRTFQIDPLGLLRAGESADDPLVAPNGARFRRTPGILPGILDELFPRREAARAAGDKVTSQAIKILMNSFYGVLGTPACRFYDPRLANAITGFGRELLLWTKARCEALGHEVLYGDTDSLFVRAGTADAAAARATGESLVQRLNDDLARHVEETWRVTSRLSLKFEKLYLRLLFPSMRHATGGARKRYAGLVDDPRGARLEFVGMEVVRRDWTALAKTVQRELYRRLFADEPVEAFLAGIVRDVREGRLDDQLVYRKSLRKDLDEYTLTTPPHVAAARKGSGAAKYVIEYVMTVNGAEPDAERQSPIDHEHYVQKQVRPVTEPVLAVLGLEFDRVIGDDRQGRLF